MVLEKKTRKTTNYWLRFASRGDPYQFTQVTPLDTTTASEDGFLGGEVQVMWFGNYLWTPTTHGKMKVSALKPWVNYCITPKHEGNVGCPWYSVGINPHDWFSPQLFQLNQGSFTRLTQWAQQAGFHQAAEWLTTEQVVFLWPVSWLGWRWCNLFAACWMVKPWDPNCFFQTKGGMEIRVPELTRVMR